MKKIWLVLQREYAERVRKKSFILTTILMPILMSALMVVPAVILNMQLEDKRQIVVVDRSGVLASNLASNETLEFVVSSDTVLSSALQDTAYVQAYGFLVIGPDVVNNPSDLTLYTRQSSTRLMEEQIRHQISRLVEQRRIESYGISSLDSIIRVVAADARLTTYQIDETDNLKESSAEASLAMAYIGGFIVYMFVFMYGSMVMQGVIEEKSNRIVEVIVSSVKPFELMMGKILGIGAVALTQVAIWVVLLSGVGSAVMGWMMPDAVGVEAMTAQTSGMSNEIMNAIGTLTDPLYMLGLLGGFVLLFMGGYLLYAAMFAAIGSAVDNVMDTQQLQHVVLVPLMLALILLMSVMNNPHSGVAFWCSLIPFTSPIIMMARLPYGVPGWELALSIVLLYASFIAMTWFAGKIYRVGIFMYGKKPSLRELIRWSRYK